MLPALTAFSRTQKIIVAVTAALLVALFLVLRAFLGPAGPDQLNEVQVKPGMSSGQIAEMLANKGLIRSPWAFSKIVSFKQLENSLQTGWYALSPAMTVTEIVDRIANGKVLYDKVTVPEGYTVVQIGALLEKQRAGKAEAFRTAAKSWKLPAYASAPPNILYPAEGFLYPDTYNIPRGTEESKVLALMARHFEQQIGELLRTAQPPQGLTRYELLTLASIVEREAQLPEDRPLIAGVLLHRLRIGMPLQADACIQYILGEPKEELSIKDTQLDSPYNTYRVQGLPPGPIANPGLAAIKAVLQPQATDYFYYVADKKGKHHFTRTYEEHLRKVEEVRP